MDFVGIGEPTLYSRVQVQSTTYVLVRTHHTTTGHTRTSGLLLRLTTICDDEAHKSRLRTMRTVSSSC